MERKPAKLRNLRVTRVDLVDRGANQQANIVFYKRDGPEATEPLTKLNRGDAVNDNWLRRVVVGMAKKLGLSDEDLSKMAPMMPKEMMEHEKAMQEFWNLKYALTRSIDSIMQSDEIEMDKKMGMVGEAVKQFQDSCKAVMPHVQMEQDMYKVESLLEDIDAAGTDVAKVQEVVKALQPPDDTPAHPPLKKKEGEATVPVTYDEFVKSLTPEQRALLEAEMAKKAAPAKVEIPAEITKRLDDLEKVANLVPDLQKRATEAEAKLAKAETDLAAERENRVSRDFLAKGAKYPTSGTPEQVAAKLRKAYAVSPEFGAEIEADLARGEQLADDAKLFEEVGKGGRPAETSAEAKLDNLAKERVTKGLAKTYEQAYTEVVTSQPELYRQYEIERGGK